MSVTQSSPPAAANSSSAEVDSSIFFPSGLVGCSSWKRFVLLSDSEQDLPVALLQSLDEPSVSLMVTDPRLVQADYAPTLSDEDRRDLGLTRATGPVIYCTLSIAADGSITANLLGPLVINPETRHGKQLVLADSAYSARHSVGSVGVQTCSS